MRRSSLVQAMLPTATVAQSLYINPDIYDNTNFFNKFDFMTFDDPTSGYVDYVNFQTAVSNSMVSVTPNTVKFGADYKQIPSNTARGRMSVRLESKQVYNKGLLVADFAHMPANTCGAWPAFWTFGEPWPDMGEIGVNGADVNNYSLHTKSMKTCQITRTAMKGTTRGTDCGLYDAKGNEANINGCGVTSAQNNLMDGLNNSGGGVYVMQWTSNYIRFWYFPKGSVPPSIQSKTGVPNVSEFGPPDGSFYGCDFDKHMKNQKLAFTNTFCGEWAGSADAYPGGGVPLTCASSCQAEVQMNPGKYANSYWEVNSLRWYAENPAFTTADFDNAIDSAYLPKPKSSSAPSSSKTSSPSSSRGSSPSPSPPPAKSSAPASAKSSGLPRSSVPLPSSSSKTLSTAVKAPASASVPVVKASPVLKAIRGRVSMKCGNDNDGNSCPSGYCCSRYGWCGLTTDYCGRGCQSAFGVCN